MAERKPFLLRIDGRTLDLVKEWADDEFRSLNGQIEFILRQALSRTGRWKPPPGKAMEESEVPDAGDPRGTGT
jgi:hypothetical protein